MPHQRGTNRVRRLVKYGRVIVLGAVVSFAAIYLIFTQLRDNDLSLIGAALRNARYSYVALSALIIAAGLFARGARWRALLNNDLSFWRAFSINNVAYLINGLIPFRVGELAKIYLATRAEPPVPVIRSTSTIIIERLIDLISIFVITLLVVSQGDLPEYLRPDLREVSTTAAAPPRDGDAAADVLGIRAPARATPRSHPVANASSQVAATPTARGVAY